MHIPQKTCQQMMCHDSHEQTGNPYALLYEAAKLIPIQHYLLALLISLIVFLYNFLEFHFFEDLFTGLRGSPVHLTYHPGSDIYNAVVSKCRILHGRYLATPWLASPHIQTMFLNFFGRSPVFCYRRELFHASDGGTIALDWLMSTDVSGDERCTRNSICKDDATPIMVVIPGLTSDSASHYIKHLAFKAAKHGWNVLVSNHRGLGGITVTSDCFYNAGWTEDAREVINHLHHVYAKAPLYVVGTSIGANILYKSMFNAVLAAVAGAAANMVTMFNAVLAAKVKYLGEDGDNVPIAGAVAICSPWDLLVVSQDRPSKFHGYQNLGDRFISRWLLQKMYDRALTIGLQGYALLHQLHFSRLADWKGILKARSIRDFDNYATRIVGKYETVDTFYRSCSSTLFVSNVSVPLLCISALDDPLCTREAIPWDECRANRNIVLAATKHGGHLAFFEGVSASGLWWVGATLEFFSNLHRSPYMHKQNKTRKLGPPSLDTSIDQGQYISVSEGMVAVTSEESNGVAENFPEEQKGPDRAKDEVVLDSGVDVNNPARRCLNQLSQENKIMIWLLRYIAIVSSWPLVRAGIRFLLKKRLGAITLPKL